MITARVPRTVCPEHGVKRATVRWAREGSGFTLLFEQAAMVLVRIGSSTFQVESGMDKQ